MSSISIASYCLFAILTGDMVFDTYKDLSSIRFLAGQLYVYCWCFVSIDIFNNVFTIIVEEGFMSCKYDSNTDWLLKHLNSHEVGTANKEEEN